MVKQKTKTCCERCIHGIPKDKICLIDGEPEQHDGICEGYKPKEVNENE
jgi:hypothetical protein